MCTTCYGHQPVIVVEGKPVPIECPECHGEEKPEEIVKDDN